jgi:transcriptional regulator with XRE-family HTH domain
MGNLCVMAKSLTDSGNVSQALKSNGTIRGNKMASPDTSLEMGRRLRRLRLAMKMTMAEFVEHTGVTVTVQAWNHYESGFRFLPAKEAMNVSSATGVDLNWIYRGIERGCEAGTLAILDSLPEEKVPPKKKWLRERPGRAAAA